MKKYYQCELGRPSTKFSDAREVMRGWIPERAAVLNATVEVLPDKGFWNVDRVFGDLPMLDVELRDRQEANRKPPPSLRKERR